MKIERFHGHDLNFVNRIKKYGCILGCMPSKIEFNKKIPDFKKRFLKYLHDQSQKEKSVLQLRITDNFRYYYDSNINTEDFFVDTNEENMLKIFTILSKELEKRNLCVTFYISNDEKKLYSVLYHPFLDGLSFVNVFLGFFNREAPVNKLPYMYIPLLTDSINLFHVMKNGKNYIDNFTKKKSNFQYIENKNTNHIQFNYLTMKFELDNVKQVKKKYSTSFSLMIVSIVTFGIFQTTNVEKLNIRYIIAVNEKITSLFNKLTSIDITLQRHDNFENYVKHVNYSFDKYKNYAILAYSILNLHNIKVPTGGNTIDVQFSGFPLVNEKVKELDIKSISSFSPFSPSCIHVSYLSDTKHVFLSFSFHTKDVDKQKLTETFNQLLKNL